MIRYRFIIIAAFLFFLLSPVIGWIAGINVQLDEKRNLSEMPGLSIEKLMDQTFFSDFERYFNDHFAYRVWLIRTKNWIDYHIFNTSPSPKVYLGTNGWLYYRVTIRDYLKFDDCRKGENTHMRDIARQIYSLEKLVEASGRKFVLIISPNKSTIYPEHVGITRPKSICRKSRYDLFLDSLKEFPVKNFIRLDNLFFKIKKNQQLYYRTDTHWNLNGSIIASKVLLQHLAPLNWQKFFPDIRMGTYNYQGDLSKMMAVKLTEETAAIKKIDYHLKVKKTNLGRFKSGDRFRFTVNTDSNRQLLPRTIIYRDSFTTRMLPFLQGSFKQLDVVWSNDVTTFLTPEPIEELQSSGIVILEINEKYLPGFTIDLSAWKAALS